MAECIVGDMASLRPCQALKITNKPACVGLVELDRTGLDLSYFDLRGVEMRGGPVH